MGYSRGKLGSSCGTLGEHTLAVLVVRLAAGISLDPEPGLSSRLWARIRSSLLAVTLAGQEGPETEPGGLCVLPAQGRGAGSIHLLRLPSPEAALKNTELGSSRLLMISSLISLIALVC